MQDNIDRPIQFSQVLANRGSHPSAYSVPFHSASEHFANCKTNARPGSDLTGTPAVQGSQVPGETLFSLLVHKLKVRVF